MKPKRNGFSRQYEAALRTHLKRRPASLNPAKDLGCQAMTLGLATLDLARIHERALTTLVLTDDSPTTRDGIVRRAGTFFAGAITPIEKTHRTAQEANARLKQTIQTLSQRSAELAVSNAELQREIIQRKSVEQSLKKSEQHHARMFKQAQHMQDRLRLLSRQLLSAQEEER